MFRVDRTASRISRLTQKRFGDLALRERDHLQEWLVHQPDALGEDLLILQRNSTASMKRASGWTFWRWINPAIWWSSKTSWTIPAAT